MHLSKAPRCPDCGSPVFPGTVHACPPLIQGGQGRSDADVAEGAWSGSIVTLFLLAGLLILGYCAT